MASDDNTIMEPFPIPTAEIHVWVLYLTARCNFNCSYCIYWIRCKIY